MTVVPPFFLGDEGRQTLAAFRWSTQREQAAILAADDQLSNEQIAERVGVTRQALDKWKRQPDFQARVQAVITAATAKLANQGIREKVNRITALADRHERLCQVIGARAGDPLMAEVPGGRTGMLVAEPMLVKVYASEASPDAGDDIQDPIRPLKETRVLYKYAVDTGLLKELREIEKHIAQELGQWSDGKTTVDVQILIGRLAEEQGWSEEEKELAFQESQRALRLLKSANA